MSLLRIAQAAGATGSIASAITTAALAGLAKARGKGALQPTNSTSHWLHGRGVGQSRKADLAHTGVGYATHHASAVFWAVPFEAWLSARPARSTGGIFLRAVAVAGIAALVDYGLVPKRFTPGWEEVLPPRDIAAVYGVLALGLAIGGLVTRRGVR
jgi:anaerobic selenocysteine-containing dehydrogenase